MVGDGLEHLHRKRILHLRVVLSLQIGDIIVRFSGLEHSEFLLNLCGHLFVGHHAVISLHNVCEHGNSSFISIIYVVFRIDSFLAFQNLIHASLLLFGSHHRVHFSSFNHSQKRAVVLSDCRSQRLENSLIERTELVSAGEVGVRLLGFGLFGNVFLETALVLKEFLVFFFGKGCLFLGRRFVIRHIHILQVLLQAFILNILQVLLNFSFVLGAKIEIGVFLNLLHMLLFQPFESQAVDILCHELLVFFLFVEGRRGEFKTPMRRVGLREGSLWIIGPSIVDVHLVVVGFVESPGELFV